MPGADWASTISQPLRRAAGESLIAEGIGDQNAQSPLGGTQVVPGLQEGRRVHAEDSGHQERDGEHNSGEAEGEAGVVGEGIEHDAETLSAMDETETVESLNEEDRCGPR